MDLKASSPLLDPVLGQNMELGLCVERMELILREMLLLGPSSFFLTLLSSLHIARGFSIVTKTGSSSGARALKSI
jgi:hypothetical protein